jgi:hypothetical protein
MTIRHTAHHFKAVATLAFCLGTWPANAVEIPSGYQPGWQIDVRKAGPRLDQPVGKPLANFGAPSTRFDMGSFHAAVPQTVNYGVSYDAQGLLNISASGPHRIAAIVGWSAGEPGPQATCQLSLSLEDRLIAAWKGPILILPDKRTAQGDAQLEPGLHPVQLRMACDRVVDARVTIAIMIKTPSDRDLRPMNPADIVHPGSSPQGKAVQATPISVPPAGKAVDPPPGATTMIATRTINIREKPMAGSRRVGQLKTGQKTQVLGPTPDPAWVQLNDGGFATSAYLKVADPAPPSSSEAAPQSSAPRQQYKPGDCRAFRTPESADGEPSTYGQTCLQADGHWRVVR